MENSNQYSNTAKLIHITLICTLGVISCHNTFGVPFSFDNFQNIAENKYIRDLSNFFDLRLISYGEYAFRSRYIGYLMFAVNYWFGGLNVMSYHLVNIIIYICNAVLIYRMINMIASSSYFSGFTQCKSIEMMAFFAAAFFVIHPVHTQSVTYIVQRFESLATTFYLVSIIYYIKLRTTSDGGCWRGGIYYFDYDILHLPF